MMRWGTTKHTEHTKGIPTEKFGFQPFVCLVCFVVSSDWFDRVVIYCLKAIGWGGLHCGSSIALIFNPIPPWPA